MRWTRRSITASVLSALLLVVVSRPGGALAHEAAAREVTTSAGPYQLLVTLDSDPLRVDAPTGIGIHILGVPDSELATVSVVATVEPGLGIEAPPIGVRLPRLGGEVAEWHGALTLPTRGVWVLHLDVNGSAGSSRASIELAAAEPGAIPLWLGWLIGLSPLAGLALFARAQAGYLRQLEARSGNTDRSPNCDRPAIGR